MSAGPRPELEARSAVAKSMATSQPEASFGSITD